MLAWSTRLLFCLLAIPVILACEQSRPMVDGEHVEPRVDPYGGVIPTSGETLLTAASGFPCILELESTGVWLRAAADGRHPDPALPVYLGPDGNFYSGAQLVSRVISVWSPDGVFLDSIGRPGSGPGEFEGAPQPLIDHKGIVHAYEMAGRRYQQFSLDGRVLSSNASLMGGQTYTQIVIAGEDSILSGGGLGGRQFNVFSGNGEIVHSFGQSAGSRSVAVIDQGTFWAAPPQADPEGYVLEEWNLTGEPLRRLKRDVAWVPEPRSDGPPSPNYSLYAGRNGHLVVGILSSPPMEPGASFDPDEWLEIIDPTVPDVIASQKVRDRGQAAHPIGRIVRTFASVTPGTDLGARLYADAVGLQHVEIMRYRLRPQTTPADPRCQAD